MNTLKTLYEYFPTSVFTGNSIVFISEDWRVELTEHCNVDFSKTNNNAPVIRVKISKKALNGEFVPGHYEDFSIGQMGELATQIERYVQAAVGSNIREYGLDD